MLASTSAPSTAFTPPCSHAAEAILSRARRLSNNAFERTHPPTSFAEGEESYRPRSSSSLSSHHHRSQHNSFDALANIQRSSYTQKKRQSTKSNTVPGDESPQHGITPVISEPLSISTTTTSTISGLTMPLVQSPVEDEGKSNSNSSSTHSEDSNHSPDTFLDPNRAHHSLSCATSLTEPTSLSASLSSALTCASSSPLSALSSRPRALTSGGAGDGKLAADPHSLGHRKHQSENGGSSLVYGILAVLRQHTDLESPILRREVDDPYQDGVQEELTAAGSTLSPTTTTTTSSSSANAQEGDLGEAQAAVGEGIAINHAAAPIVGSGIDGPVADETRQDVPTSGSLDETKGHTNSATPDPPNAAVKKTVHESVSDPSKEQDPIKGASAQDEELSSVPHPASSATKDDLTLTNSFTAAKTTMSIATTTKGSFLHKMGVRKTSFSETVLASSTQDNSDTSSIKSHNTQISSTSSKLSKKRSTKFLGKLVPKFLHTSLSPTLGGHATEGGGRLSPTSTRSSRSGSTSSQSPLTKSEGLLCDSSSSLEELVGAPSPILAPSCTKGSQESLTLPEVDEVEEEEDDEDEDEKDVETVEVMELELPAPTNPEYLKNLQSDSSVTVTRQSSCSSTSGKVTTRGIKKANNAIATEIGKKVSTVSTVALCNFEVEYQEEEVQEEENKEEEGPQGKQEALKIETQTKTVEDPPSSPYIIDENCDDDFFLNSVLRKKSASQVQQTESNRPQPLQQQPLRHQSPQRYSSSPSIMSSSHPSESTLSSVRSTTPSLSGWSSNYSSSQASTPSPTSPLTLNGQVYPFPTMMKVHSQKSAAVNVSAGTGTMHQTMHMHYRTNPLPAPTIVGHDEKRSRLRDAVGEWRRATNASN